MLLLFVVVLIGAFQKTAFAAKDVVTLGFLGPITGSCAAEGSAARNAFLMAIDDANASGEYPYKINVIVVDDQSDPSVGAAGAQKIVADPTVVAATGHWNSGVAAATIPIFIENEIAINLGSDSRRSDLKRNLSVDNPFGTTNVQENKPLAKAVIDDMGYKNIFMVSTTDSYDLPTR